MLKKVVGNLVSRPNQRGSSYDYEDCLRVLAEAMERDLGEQEVWDYIVGHVNDPKFPWRGVAMSWLVSHFDRYWQDKKDLAEKVLSQPDHEGLRAALHAYAELAEKDEAGPRLEAIAKDKRYPEDDRDYAREAWDKLFVNPFLRIEVDRGEPFAKELLPLKSVTIANISPQTLTLPVEKAEYLIFVRMTDDEDGGTPVPVAGSGQLHLKPGEKIVLHDVKWWRGLDPTKIKNKKGESESFTLHAATPGLWDVPAGGSGISVDGNKLLKILRKKP